MLGETFRRGFTVLNALRLLHQFLLAAFGISIWGAFAAWVNASVGTTLVIALFLIFVLWLGRFREVRIASAWGWRNYLPWGVLWTYDALMSIRRNDHGVFVGGFWISGFNRSRNAITLDSARINSLVTNTHLVPKVATDPHYVALEEANRIPPLATVSLQFLFTDRAKDGQPGVTEEAFWRDFGEFEFETTYGGKTRRQRFNRHVIEAYFNKARPKSYPSNPRVTRMGVVTEPRQEPAPAYTLAALSPQARAALGIERPRYTEKPREERHDAWRAIYEVLDGPFDKAMDKLSYVANTWKEAILANPKDYSERLGQALSELSAATNEIMGIYRRYGWHTDIASYFEDQSTGWGPSWGTMSEAINILRTTLKRFHEPPSRQVVELLDPQAQAVRTGVGGVGKWRSEAKKYAVERLNELGKH